MFWTVINAVSSVFSALYGFVTQSNGKSFDALQRENDKLREELSDRKERSTMMYFIVGIIVFLVSFILCYLIDVA